MADPAGPVEASASPRSEGAWPNSRPVLLVLATAVGLAFLLSMLTSTEGHFVPQVVDLYLTAQYAKAMAEGHPFHYNPGEPASTGATSLLHTAVLAAAHLVGIRGEGLVAFAVLLGGACYVASLLLARRIALRLAGEREGLLAGALVALGGPVVWGFFYGADVALFMFLCLWLFDALLEGWPRWQLGGTGPRGAMGGRAWTPAVLLALARPEGLPIVSVLGLAFLLGPGRAARGAARLWPLVPALAGLLVLALYLLLTGSVLGTSIADKSLVANYGWRDSIGLGADYLQDVLRGLLLGFYPSQVPVGFARGWAPYYFPPLSLLLVALAVARPPEAHRQPLRLWLTVIASVGVLVTPNTFMGVHYNRYLMWTFPSLLVLTAVGLSTLTRLLARGDLELEASLFRAGARLCVAFSLLGTVRMAVAYGELSGEVWRRDVAAARWIGKNLPRGAAMANIVTSVEYLTGHRNLNLHGVSSPAFFGGRKAEREADSFEALGRLAEAERPDYLISSVNTQDAYPSLGELVQGPPLYRSSSLGDDILIFRMRFDLVGKNGRQFSAPALQAVQGLTEVDRLNVCDRRDESDHDYEYQSHQGDLRLFGTAHLDAYRLAGGGVGERVIDGGRAILGYESFRVRAQRGKDLVVAMRTAPAVGANVLRTSGSGTYEIEFPEAAFVVEIEGLKGADTRFRPEPGWSEHTFRIPGHFLGEGATRLRLSGRYASFYYWFYQ